ncbi:hypothetical protein ACIBBD_28680 [Streptomyces sp. NPDC051315]|uniref:hypothetical protein n=1 Tax=Streptomyces sp. NPDC051315 TaxID=3365650 RepID=UPI0037B9D5CF
MAEFPAASDWCQRWNGRRHSFRLVGEGGVDARRHAVELLPEKEVNEHIEAARRRQDRAVRSDSRWR